MLENHVIELEQLEPYLDNVVYQVSVQLGK